MSLLTNFQDLANSVKLALDRKADKSEIPVIPELATVATSGSYNDLSDKPAIPTAGTITSGSTGYATGGDVYSAIGNIPQIPVGTNTGDILVWDGSAWVARQQGTLPAGYRQTQYIEFTGTEYVDTGVKLSDIVDVRCDISFTDLTEMGNNGANEGDDQNAFMMNYRPGTPNKISFGYKTYGGGNYWAAYDKLGPEIDSADTIYQVFVSLRDRAVYFGATKYTPNYTMVQSLLGSNTYYIGAANNAGVPQLPAKERVYILTFYNYRSERIADFVPCVREADNKAGLYDVVGEQFHAIQIIE